MANDLAYMKYSARRLVQMKFGREDIAHLYPPKDPSRQNYLCYYCPRRYFDVDACVKHIELHETSPIQATYQCKSCKYLDLNIKVVTKHILLKHEDIKNVKDNIRLLEPPELEQPGTSSNTNSKRPSSLLPQTGQEKRSKPNGSDISESKTEPPFVPVRGKINEAGIEEIDISDDTPRSSPVPVDIVNGSGMKLKSNDSGARAVVVEDILQSTSTQIQQSEEDPVFGDPPQQLSCSQVQAKEHHDVHVRESQDISHISQLDHYPHSQQNIYQSQISNGGSLSQQSEESQPRIAAVTNSQGSSLAVPENHVGVPPLKRVRFKEGIKVKHLRLLDYNYLGEMILESLDKIHNNPENSEEAPTTETTGWKRLKEDLTRREPYIELPKGCFNKSFWIQSIEFKNYGPANVNFTMEGLEGKSGAIIYSTPDLASQRQQIIPGILDSVGLLEIAHNGPVPLIQNKSLKPVTIKDKKSSIKLSLRVLGDFDSITRQDQPNWTELQVLRTYKNDSLVSVTTSESSAVLLNPEWNSLLRVRLGFDFPYPKLLYMCENNIEWLWEQKTNWEDMAVEIISHKPISDLYKSVLCAADSDTKLLRDKYQFVLNCFQEVFHTFLEKEGLEGDIFVDYMQQHALITDVYVKPRGLFRRVPKDSEHCGQLMSEASEDERRTVGIALFFSFWSIMNKIPFLVCDLVTEADSSSGKYIPIKGIKYYLNDLVVKNGKVNPTQQIFFTSRMSDGLRRGRNSRNYKNK